MLTLRVLVAASVVLAVLSASPGLTAGDTIPRDFRLTAEYYPPLPNFGADGPGVEPWHRWMLTVTAEGKALQESQRSARGSTKGLRTRSVRLARRDLERLVTTVRASNFHLMAADYAFEVSHAPALVLRITMDGRYHEVTVYAPDKVKHEAEVAAFLRIWNEVIILVPPPNPGQRTE
jgi:hypothetical protein